METLRGDPRFDPDRGFLGVLPVADWSTYTRRPHLEPFARFGPLLFVERPEGFARSLPWFRRTTAVATRPLPAGARLVRPAPRIPRRPKLLGALRRRAVGDAIRRAMDAAGLDRPVAILTTPAQRWFFDLGIECRAVCFELSDEFSLYLEYGEQRSATKFAELVDMVRRSDLVFATARSLAQKFSVFHPRVHWVPNTAVPADFAVDEGTAVLPDLRGLPRPVIGFIGGLNPWIDVELLLELRRLRPAWTIVFSAGVDGPPGFVESAAVQQLLQDPNSPRLLGWVPYPRLREFLRGIDVAALFHRADELGTFLHPNKIYMYLAAGKPIVSTPFLPELECFGDLVRVAPNASRFVAAIESVLEGEDPSLRDARIERARACSPEARAARKVEIVDQYLCDSSEGCGDHPGRSV